MDICKFNDLLFLNGRKLGDLSGSFTSHQWNGSAVVDYVLSPNWFIKNIPKFSVGNFIPWLSDHCPLHTTIVFNGLRDNKAPKNSLSNMHPGFIWNVDTRAKYENGLKSKAVEEKIKIILRSETTNPISIANEIREILMNNATNCNIKKKKVQNDEQKSAPWFDKSCTKKKNEIRKLGNAVKKNPNERETRTELMSQKKILKKLIRAKKTVYKNNTINKMRSMKNSSPKQFWNLFRKLSPNKESSTGEIHPDSFGTFFKTLLTSKDGINIPEDSNTNGELDYEITLKELKEASPILKPGKSNGINMICN